MSRETSACSGRQNRADREKTAEASPQSFHMQTIARIRTDFGSKFGIPRQSGLAETGGRIVFEPAFRSPEAVRGLEQFSHLWLIWVFSENADKGWHPTVRPPRLGGNTRVGVFATRSTFRPNPIALSSVRLTGIDESDPEGPVLLVSGADLMDGTPILDIKPYLPYADIHIDAAGGFTDDTAFPSLQVVFPDALLDRIPAEKREGLLSVLSQDPRPSYQNDPERVYGMEYAGFDVRFRVVGGTLTVTDV